MKLALFLSVIFCSFLLGSTTPLPKWVKIYLGLKCLIDNDTDVVHVIANVPDSDFNLAKKGAKRMTRAVNKLAEIGSSGSRIGFVLVSDPVLTYSAFHLGEHNTLSDNIDAINDVDNNNGQNTALGVGLWRAKNQFLNNPSTSRKIVLLVTNDSNTAGFGPIGPANTLKAMGVTVCVIAIGNGITDIAQLRAISNRFCFLRFPTYMAYKNAMIRASKRITDGEYP